MFEQLDPSFRSHTGKTFSYLGRVCVVTSHGNLELTYDYVDKLGVIHSASFYTGNLAPFVLQQLEFDPKADQKCTKN